MKNFRGSVMGSFPVMPSSELLASYRLVKTLGEGSYGVVWLCESRITGRQYACKVIRRDSRTLSATQREVETMSRVAGCSSIIEIHAVFEDAEWLYLLLELADAGDLLRAINKVGGLSEASAKPLFRQLVRAVAHCHANGVVHRDLKPENIFLSKPVNAAGTHQEASALVKLGDFGLAVHLNAGKVSGHAGSFPYEAPEVMDPTQYYDTSADVWSLGVVLYAMISAMWPTFKENQRRLDESCDWSEPCWAAVSPVCKDLIRRLLTVDPASRPTTADLLCHPWLLEEAPVKPQVQAQMRAHMQAQAEAQKVAAAAAAGGMHWRAGGSPASPQKWISDALLFASEFGSRLASFPQQAAAIRV